MTKELSFKKIDAFATNESSGNPAGYIVLEELTDLSESEMLQIAKELKGFVNEVGYVAKVGEYEFDLRYYSSEREVDFCGHATVAIFYDIIKTNPYFWDVESIKINTNRGSLEVLNEVEQQDAVFILSPAPDYKPELCPNMDKIADALSISRANLDNSMPATVINAGLNTLIVPINGLTNTLSIAPDYLQLKRFCEGNGIDIILVFTSETHNKGFDYRTRVFAPTFGYLEDPATGSGNSALGYYLMKNSKWHGDAIKLEQNNKKKRNNVVKLRASHQNGEIRVYFGGGAMTRISGDYQLHGA